MSVCPHCGSTMPDQLGLSDIAEHKSRRGDSTTAKAAAVKAMPKAGTQRRRLLDLFAQRYPGGLTADEATRLTNYPYVSVSTRISELKQGSWLYVTGQTRETRNREQAQVLALTGRACEQLGLARVAA